MIKQLALDIRLRDDATFENYIGVLKHRLTESDFLNQDQAWYFLWGAPGQGKSHLLQALCHQTDGSIYLSNLANYEPDILQGLEAMPLICLDDIELIITSAAWQEALFHLMNAVKDNGQHLLLASSKPAAQLDVQLPDLASRLKHATPLASDKLDDAEKAEVLMLRAEKRGFKLSPEVAAFVLARVTRSLPELMNLIDRLEQETLSQGKLVTIPFVKEVFEL